MEVTIQAHQILDKTVKPMGTSGGIYLPRSWIGQPVKIFLLEPIKEVSEE
jgi:putative transposon-encoded protein